MSDKNIYPQVWTISKVLHLCNFYCKYDMKIQTFKAFLEWRMVVKSKRVGKTYGKNFVHSN
jgi:hypothetical protein